VPQRQANGDSCVACHMPKANSSNIVHVAVTDHRILKRPAPDSRPKAPVPPNELPLAIAGNAPSWPDDAEAARDLAVGLARQAELSPTFLPAVAEHLTEATRCHPRDADAWESLAAVRLAQGNTADALAAAEQAVAARPGKEAVLGRAAEAALRAGKPGLARGYAERAIAINPGDPNHHVRLALALIDEDKTADAERTLKTALTMTPNDPAARAAWAVCLYKLGRPREAMAELERAAGINPADAAAVRQLFTARVR